MHDKKFLLLLNRSKTSSTSTTKPTATPRTLQPKYPMAKSQNRKRQGADESSRANINNPSSSESNTRSEIGPDAWASRKSPSEFRDRPSSIRLTHRAVEEHTRRTRLRRPSHPSLPTPRQRELAQHTAAATARDLARFARHGGPGLTDLRGVRRYERSLPSALLTSPSSIPTP